MANAVIAFKDYNVVDGVWGSDWVGLAELRAFFDNPVFWTLLRNTFVLSAYVVLASFPIPIILALALNEVRLRFFKQDRADGHLRAVLHLDGGVVSMTILFLLPALGLVNDAFGFFGIGSDRLPQRTRTTSATSTSGRDVWQTTGYSAVIYLAALAGDRPDAVRGGEGRRRHPAAEDPARRHPGHPADRDDRPGPGVGNVMAIGFEKAFLLQNPLNLSQSEIIPTYIYKIGLLNADFSQAAAIGLFNSVINLVLLLAVNAVAKRLTGNGLW